MGTLLGKPEVVVAMSGGVDSSVAAALLAQQGYHVTGVTMKIWDGPPSSGARHHGCYGPGEESDIEDAREVTRRFGIPFHVVDLSSEYRSEIMEYVRREYLNGRTPNPCSYCNPRIKFGALVEKIAGQGVRFDYFATGHYARVEYSPGENRFFLKKARDTAKDQSYFLALLSREQLAHTLFPLGKYFKTEVRKLALDFSLDVAAKLDSQDFVPGGYESVLGLSIPGPVLDSHGEEIGRHRGIAYYTVGQRRGLGIASDRPLYVTRLDPTKNVVIVGDRDEVYADNFIASNLNWLAIDSLHGSLDIKVRIRSRHEEAEALVTPLENGKVYVKFKEPQFAVTPGQTAVFYNGDIVVGGGTIEKAKE
jgi:tRNA-uridine 2-sulfurtransferase